MVASIFSYYRKAFAGLPAGVWAFSLVLFVHRTGTMVLPFLSLHLKDHLGLPAASAAQMLSLYGVGSIFGSLLGGYLTSRLGAIRVVVLSLTAVSPIFLLLLAAKSMAAAGCSIFLLSLVGDAVRPAAMTATAELCGTASLNRAFALNRLAVNLGMSIGPAVAGLLYATHFEVIFYVDAVTCLMAAGLVWSIFPLRPSANAPSQVPEDCSATQRRLWKDWMLLLVLVQFCFVMVIFLQNISSYPIYLRDRHGMPEASIGLLFTINTVLIVLFEMVLIASMDRFRKLPIIGIGCVLICLGFGMVPFAGSVSLICLTVVIWTLGEMLSMPLLTSWIGERAPPAARAQYMAASTTVFSIAWVIAPVFGGTLYGWNPDAIWYVSLGLAVAIAGGFLLLTAAERRGEVPDLAKS